MNRTLIRKIHRIVGLVSSLFFLVIALSGIILNHSYSGYRSALAGDLPQSAVWPAYLSCGQGSNGPASVTNILALADDLVAAGKPSMDGAAREPYFLQARYGPQGGGPVWNRGGSNPGGDVTAAGSQQPPAGTNVWKLLHTGRFLGLSSVFCDLTALALIVTVLTGLYLYFGGLRREKC